MAYYGPPGLTKAYIDTLGKAVESGLSGNPTLFAPGVAAYTDGIAFYVAAWDAHIWDYYFKSQLNDLGDPSYWEKEIQDNVNSNQLSDDLYSSLGSGNSAEIFHVVKADTTGATNASSTWRGPTAGTGHGGSFVLAVDRQGTVLVLTAGNGQTVSPVRITDDAGNGLVDVSMGGVVAEKGLATSAITSGALPTVAPVSGAAFQCSTARDVELHVPVTFNPGVATTATCKVELSPDNVTFSTLVTETLPVGTVFDGTVRDIRLQVPAGWRVKLTVTNATLGTGTYY